MSKTLCNFYFKAYVEMFYFLRLQLTSIGSFETFDLIQISLRNKKLSGRSPAHSKKRPFEIESYRLIF